MEDKVKILELELEKTRKTSYETTVPLEAKVSSLPILNCCWLLPFISFLNPPVVSLELHNQ